MNYLKPFYPQWDAERAQELLRQFELPRDRKIRNLSHGMRMKAALASSLAYRPRLIVLDEPFTGLDALVRDELIEGVLECADGATILISSHDLSEVESFASHIGYLDRGRLQFSEEMASLVDRFREIEITLANPSPSPISWPAARSEEHTSELQSRLHLVCRLLLEKKKTKLNMMQRAISIPSPLIASLRPAPKDGVRTTVVTWTA